MTPKHRQLEHPTLNLLTNALGISLVLTDTKGRIISANEVSQRQTGRKLTPGKKILSRTPLKRQPEKRSLLKRLIENGEGFDNPDFVHTNFRPPKGFKGNFLVPGRFIGQPLFDENGTHVGFGILNIESTGQGARELSHHLGNATMNLAWFRRGRRKSTEAIEHLKEMEGLIKKAMEEPENKTHLEKALEKNQLATTKLVEAAGNFETVHSTHEFMEGIINVFRTLGTNNSETLDLKDHLDFIKKISPTDVDIKIEHGKNAIVKLNPSELHLSLLNAIKNARNAVKSDPTSRNKRPVITIKVVKKGENVHIITTNNGPAFPKEIIADQGKTTGITNGKGTGLGLPGIRQFVTTYEGKFKIENKNGVPTHTWIFPLKEKPKK